MVRLTDSALKSHLGKPEGLRNPHVSIVDPAMGTGTYPLSVLTSCLGRSRRSVRRRRRSRSR